GNQFAGVQFNVGTVGWEKINVSWSQRVDPTASRYVRLQYSTNGTTFFDFCTATAMSSVNTFEPKTNSLPNDTGVWNEPNFAFRIVAEFESTAVTNANANYVTAPGGTTYAT